MSAPRLLTAAVAAVMVATGGAVAAPVPPAPPVRVDRCVVQGGPAPSAASGASAARSPAVPVDQPKTQWFADSSVDPVGDLNRDGAADVVHTWTRSRMTTTGFEREVAIEARRGQDGRLLWTSAIPVDPLGPYPYQTAYGAKIGPRGVDGVVVTAIREVRGVLQVVIRGFDGSGRVVWQQEVAATSLGVAMLLVRDVVDAARGPASDVVIESPTWIGVAPASVEVMQPKVLDGATGEIVDVGPPAVSEPGGVLFLTAVPDVTGDQLYDLAVVDRAADGIGCLSVRGGVDGRVRWSAVAGPVHREVAISLPGGDVTGDGRGDLWLAWAHGELRVWDGATGRPLWRRPVDSYGEIVGRLGDIDRRPGAEVAVINHTNSRREVRARIEAVDAAGRARWRADRRFPVPAGWSQDEAGFVVFEAGDVQGDGTPDLFYQLGRAYDRPVPPGHDGWLDGRTGAAHRAPDAGLWPLRAAVDGRGADLANVTLSHGVLTATVYDGESGRLLWSTGVRILETWASPVAYAVRLDRDRCADILARAVDDLGMSHLVFDGATGRPKWSLRAGREGGQPTLRVAPLPERHTDRNSCR